MDKINKKKFNDQRKKIKNHKKEKNNNIPIQVNCLGAHSFFHSF